MKKKVSPNQLPLNFAGQGGAPVLHFTQWHDKRLIAETNWLFNIASIARKDYERNKPNEKYMREAARVKHSNWAVIKGERVSVSQAKAVVKFLDRFNADQKERVKTLKQFCAELNERGFDTSQIDEFIALETGV